MIKCPVCREYEFERVGDNDVCPVCDWENDLLQYKDPNFWGGANELSLNDYRSNWKQHSEYT